MEGETVWLTQKMMAEHKALAEYQEFNKTQKIESDFEKEVKKMVRKGGKKELKFEQKW